MSTAEQVIPTTDSNPAVITFPQKVDIFDRQLQSGDMIVYATRRGSSTFLNKLRVTEVLNNGVRGFCPDDINRRMRTITNMSTVAKVF